MPFLVIQMSLPRFDVSEKTASGGGGDARWDLEMTSRDSPSIECSKNTLHGEVELGESKRPTLRFVNDMSCNVGFEENSAHARVRAKGE